MLFYAALTVAGVIAAAIAVWVLRSLTVASKSAYRTLSPAARAGSQAKLAHLNSNLAATPAPWGWGNGKGAPTSGFDRHRFQQASVSPSKSRDWSELEVYSRSSESSAKSRNAGHSVGSVRNVLTGYDMGRSTEPDTSSWPYQDNLGSPRSAEPDENTQAESDGERPTKPWGW